MLDVLEQGGIVLVFPEGKSHSDPELAPLKTGLARIALMARDERRLTVPIVPVGLTFERKWEPRSRVLMHVGRPVSADAVAPNADAVTASDRPRECRTPRGHAQLPDADDARRVLAVSTTLAGVLDVFRPLRAPDPPLAESVRVAQRINAIAPRLLELEPTVAARVQRFLERFAEFEQVIQDNAIAASDVQMDTGVGAGAWFVIRELLIGAVAGPLALWGRANHWLPVRIARWLALRRSRTPDEPAMNTIVAGLVLVLTFYSAQTIFVGWMFGWITALAYAISLPISATWDFRYADRLRRAVARVRTYVRFRRDRRAARSPAQRARVAAGRCD